MDTFKDFETQLYAINEVPFENIALRLFRFQVKNNPIYRRYVDYLGTNVSQVESLVKIPFLPISFFKHHNIQTGAWTPEVEFRSSGTTGQNVSRHFVHDLGFYHRNAERCFSAFFGNPKDYHFLALLPSYLERAESSLITMMNHLIQRSGSPYSGFYLYDYDRLARDADNLREGTRRVIVWGVTFALLELADRLKPDLSHCIIVETGGMKGRRPEMTRDELHSILKKSLNVGKIVSEYGMTELMSQAYSLENGQFSCPPGMKALVRDVTDPLECGFSGSGALNFIDLANFHSVSFLETEDLGEIDNAGTFSVVGRMDNSDVRGCNLLVSR